MTKIAEYMDHMGSDLSVVNAARVSFSKTSTELTNSDISLINFLAKGMPALEYESLVKSLAEESDYATIDQALRNIKNQATHWTPFGHTAITLRMKAPIPIRTQAFKHKIGFVENEESRRYIKSTPELYIPKSFRSAPSGNVKQGSGGDHVASDQWIDVYKRQCQSSINVYEEMIETGIAPEQARFVLPQGVYVNWVWTGSLAAFARYCQQRLDSHAQAESNDVAKAISEIISPLFPHSWKALLN